ncbi:hypothetical protein VNO78_30380 [Psophocarpus tetragonolobus]|uniref:Uncharacterized protein n=1 Tax=Psophocarpus tetragonolobus TaxID=3891 RepID=A0AAN9RWH7_PSOTE
MYFIGCLLAPIVRCFGKKPSCPSFLVFCGAWFRVVVLSAMDKLKLKFKWLCNIVCIGCCKRSTGITTMDEASKGLRSQGQTVSKVDGSEDFWSTSTFELDHSYAATSNNPSDPQSSGGSQSDPPEFVNHGKASSLESDKATMVGIQKVREYHRNSRTKNKVKEY